jgi:hypothetical protein
MNRTVREIRKRYEWPNLKREVEGYVRKCRRCQVNKTLGARHKAPMEITTTARKPFEMRNWHSRTDHRNKGNTYILTFQDDLTKFVIAEPIQTQNAETAREFVRNIILKFGAPEVILSDQGSNFLSELFRNTCRLLRIKINITTFHPESNSVGKGTQGSGGVPKTLHH